MEGTPRGGASRTGSSAREPGTNASVPASASTASATLSEKKELQENHWRSRPDAKRPRTAPPPAPPTSSGGKEVVITDNVVGITSAAPTPITARAAISADGLETNTAAPAAAPKTTSPATSTPRRP